MEIPKKIIWLASYPKSGNTWFRAFLTALLNDGEVDINDMKTDGIFSSRAILDNFTDLNSTYLTDDEANILQPEVYNNLASVIDKEQLFIKVHDAYTLNKSGNPIIPTKSSKCAIYFIRNPLDVAGSFANHNGSAIDEAIGLMNNHKGSLAKQKGNFNVNNQFKQLMLDWSSHVESWTKDMPFPVLVIRYEDMLLDTFNTFNKAIAFAEIKKTKEEIESAIEMTNFEKLKEQEKNKGFSEKNRRSETFFRNGKAGNWINDLSNGNINTLTKLHNKTMKKYDYIP